MEVLLMVVIPVGVVAEQRRHRRPDGDQSGGREPRACDCLAESERCEQDVPHDDHAIDSANYAVGCEAKGHAVQGRVQAEEHDHAQHVVTPVGPQGCQPKALLACNVDKGAD